MTETINNLFIHLFKNSFKKNNYLIGLLYHLWRIALYDSDLLVSEHCGIRTCLHIKNN